MAAFPWREVVPWFSSPEDSTSLRSASSFWVTPMLFADLADPVGADLGLEARTVLRDGLLVRTTLGADPEREEDQQSVTPPVETAA